MDSNADAIRRLLNHGPLSSRDLQQRLSWSQPTVSRALTALGAELLRVGAGRSTLYSLQDADRGLPSLPVYRIDAAGRLHELGRLIPVRPSGFLMQQPDGRGQFSDGLPWWLSDMRPQGYLGRAFAQRHAEELQLPAAVHLWDERHVLRALLAFGHDAVGDLLLGERVRQRFLSAPPAEPISLAARPAEYARLAALAGQGELPGSSAGGEQPKFTAYVGPRAQARHVLVKFSLSERNPVSQRWRDLLLAEHWALRTLGAAGVPAAQTEIVEQGNQRFLEVERFDRQGERGRQALYSLGSLDDEFVGDRSAPWPLAVRALVGRRVVDDAAVPAAALLYAYGLLIGNTDMHAGNLSFQGEPGRALSMAPAYDMLPMGFAPKAGGGLPEHLPHLALPAFVPHASWRQALALALTLLERLRLAQTQGSLSREFGACLDALQARLDQARGQIERMA